MNYKLYALLFLSLLTVYSCGTLRQQPLVAEHLTRDTLYLSSQHFDSVFVFRDRQLDRSRDTVYLKDSILEYRYKLLRDTIYKVQHDSIPYEVRIETVREVPRRRNILDYISYACLGLVIGSVLTRLYHYFR